MRSCCYSFFKVWDVQVYPQEHLMVAGWRSLYWEHTVSSSSVLCRTMCLTNVKIRMWGWCCALAWAICWGCRVSVNWNCSPSVLCISQNPEHFGGVNFISHGWQCKATGRFMTVIFNLNAWECYGILKIGSKTFMESCIIESRRLKTYYGMWS